MLIRILNFRNANDGDKINIELVNESQLLSLEKTTSTSTMSSSVTEISDRNHTIPKAAAMQIIHIPNQLLMYLWVGTRRTRTKNISLGEKVTCDMNMNFLQKILMTSSLIGFFFVAMKVETIHPLNFNTIVQ